MRTTPTLAAIALILTVTAPQASAGVTCKSAHGTEHSRHSFTQGACTANSDGSGAKAIAHGNGIGSNGVATAQTLGVSKAFSGAHSSATALSSDSGAAKAISDSGSFSMADAGGAGGHAKAVSSTHGNSQVFAGPNSTATAISDHHGTAAADTLAACTAKATASTKGVAGAECAADGDEVTADATGGATAQGSDRSAPICDTSNGGTAKVTSPMGNCNN